jgi:hypothetical protein
VGDLSGVQDVPYQSYAHFIKAFWQSTSVRSSGTC